ncbi:LLM class flavin-dependent oxidoreductase [Ureaplasma sp. ES3154-GEN]|uniref:LLM class flavin-dependent oxidoreductase n=1 Tax=Ureaplasma sp. ES3154-GEN TaxID=2984844 RepID=UPI0021E7CDE3|nr:LLM class flavin-dependent oxidoreductase [Ureaplasma sp. ES3154-GEN]MCV3743603.1 LLM class flavin-dependent oxidoreductase [Ureaplasma sp. ES3154-GEN]
MKKIELGISTFGETTILENTKQPISHQQRIRDMIEEIRVADEVGLDVYGVGEHHRSDFAVSSPEMILAAGAVVSKNIKLTSAVTVLSSNDPVRVYQNFAHIDALSNGRAEIMIGRGSFTESFPLFGYSLEDYDELFDEKLKMFIHLKANEIVSWKGRFTQNIDNKGVYPRANNLPIWVATGGSYQSTINIAKEGLPIVFAVIGGDPLLFKNVTTLYRRIGEQAGHNPEQLKIGAHSWGFIADTKEEAQEKFFFPTKQLVDNIAKTRRTWQPLNKTIYEHMVSEKGAMIVGDPEWVAQRIIRLMTELDLDRFYLHLPTGSIPHEDLIKAIRLYGEKVAPIVRKHFAELDA